MTSRTNAESIEHSARQWLLRLYAQAPDDTTKAAFRAWLADDDRHADAFLAAEQLWEDLALTETAGEVAEQLKTPALVPKPKRERRAQAPRALSFWRPGLALAASLAIAALVLLHPPGAENTVRSLETAIAQTQSFNLEDGSILTLGPETRLLVNLGTDTREVSLDRGRAHFEIAQEPERPFIVSAGLTRARVIGTSFSVRRGATATDVAVQEGEVLVTSAAPGSRSENARLLGGQRLRANQRGTLGVVEAVEPGRDFDWQHGRLSYDGTPLAEVIHDLNAYRSQKIVLADAALGALQVTSSFRSDQTDQALEGLALTLPIRLKTMPDGVHILSAEP